MLNDIHIDIMDYISPACVPDVQFRSMWAEFEWENKVQLSTSICKQADLPPAVWNPHPIPASVQVSLSDVPLPRRADFELGNEGVYPMPGSAASGCFSC